MKIYVDCRERGGVHSGSGSALYYSAAPGGIGRVDRDTTIPTSYFKGTIDDFRYWNRVVNEDEVDYLCSNTGMNIQDFTSNNPVDIYPNPVRDQLNFKADFQVQSYSVYNLNGERVAYGAIHDSKLNVRQLEEGTYILKLFGKERNQTVKFIKE